MLPTLSQHKYPTVCPDTGLTSQFLNKKRGDGSFWGVSTQQWPEWGWNDPPYNVEQRAEWGLNDPLGALICCQWICPSAKPFYHSVVVILVIFLECCSQTCAIKLYTLLYCVCSVADPDPKIGLGSRSNSTVLKMNAKKFPLIIKHRDFKVCF